HNWGPRALPEQKLSALLDRQSKRHRGRLRARTNRRAVSRRNGHADKAGQSRTAGYAGAGNRVGAGSAHGSERSRVGGNRAGVRAIAHNENVGNTEISRYLRRDRGAADRGVAGEDRSQVVVRPVNGIVNARIRGIELVAVSGVDAES